MTLQTDASVGLIKDVTYGVSQTVTRFPEFTEASFQQKNDYVQGEGLRAGKIIARAARRALGQVNVEGSLEVEVATKGMGLLLEACIGSGTSTLRSGSIYQQVFTPPVTDPAPSYTVQTGIPPIGGGSVLPQTFLGCMVDSWELSAEAGGILMLSSDWIGKELVTATAYASPSYSASAGIFTFQHGSIVVGVNGTDTLTVPTTTALASTTPATANATVTKFSLKGENHLDDGGYVFGSAGKKGRRPVYGLREFVGSITFEVTSATARDWYLNQTSLQIVLTFVTDQLVSGSTYATVQIVLPAIVLEGDVPTSNAGDIITVDADYTVLDGETAASPLYVVMVTADTAL